MKRRTLLLGLGNEIRSDDAVGLLVVREIRRRLQNPENDSRNHSVCRRIPGLEIQESEEMGLALLDLLTGFDEVILVDSVKTGKFEPGTVLELTHEDLKTALGLSPHYLGIPEMLALGRAAGLPIPNRITIFAVEVKDPFTFGMTISREIETALPDIVGRILKHLLEKEVYRTPC
ncbi:MAG: hydrogenase maturation protease [bacterium JZ-2024 1]